MARAQRKTDISNDDLQKYRCTLMVHNIDEPINNNAIKKAIAAQCGLNLNQIYVSLTQPNFVHGKQSQCAKVRLPSAGHVDTIMRIEQSIRFGGKKLSISRMLPPDYFLSHQTTTGLSIQIQENTNISDQQLKTILQHFERYGSIQSNECINQSDIYVIFQHYDTVDQIVLKGQTQTIDGCTVRVQKVRVPKERRNIPYTNVQEFCIHIPNLSTKVTNEQLASLFNVHVANVLIRPFNPSAQHLVENQRTSYEAWIINVGDKQETQNLAKQMNGREFGGTIIRCKAIVEPVKIFELCEYFQIGKCAYSVSCIMKHVLCVQSDTCNDTKCWYGHTSLRSTASEHRPQTDEDGYRIQITGFPLNVTPIEILKRLEVQYANISDNLCLRKESAPSSRIIAYLIDQKSRYIAQDHIRRWHNELFSTKSTDTMHCQLELNVDYFDGSFQVSLPSMSICGSQTSSRATNMSSIKSINKDFYSKQSVNTTTTIALNTDNNNWQKVSSMNNPPEKIDVKLPPPWHLTTRKLWNSRNDSTTNVYHVTNKKGQQKNAALIYSTVSDRAVRLRLQNYRTALERLKEVDGVPKIVGSNLDTIENTTIHQKSSANLWILMDSVETTTLYDLINQRALPIREILIICSKLAHLIKQIHNRNVIHRKISPGNILINYDSSMSPEQIHVSLIDFDCAWIEQPNSGSSNLDQVKDLIVNGFYRVPQFDRQSSTTNTTDKNSELIDLDQRSRTIDTSLICAILFWMMTGREPKCSRDENGKAPHQLNGAEGRAIFGAGQDLTKIFKEHLKLVFDRGFADSKQQWSIVELEYQFQFMLELITHGQRSVDSLRASSTRATSFHVSTQSFIRFVSLIDEIKNDFTNRYASIELIHWLNENSWSGDNQTTRHYDTLIIRENRLPVKFELTHDIDCNNIRLCIQIKISDTTIIELPIGVYQSNAIKNELDNIVTIIMIEFKTFLVVHSNFKEKETSI